MSREVTRVVVVFAIDATNSTGHERQVVRTTDGDASDLVETLTAVQVALAVAKVAVEDVAVDLRDQGRSTGEERGQQYDQTWAGSSHRGWKRLQRSYRPEPESVELVTSTQLDHRTTGLGARGCGDGVSFTSTQSNGAEDLLVVGLSQSVTNLRRDFRPQAVVSQGLVQRVEESGGHEKVIHDDGLLSHRGSPDPRIGVPG